MNVGSRVRVTVTRNHRVYGPSLRGIAELIGVVTVHDSWTIGVVVRVTEGPLRGATCVFAPVYVKECPG
jgi:hypothetical protein